MLIPLYVSWSFPGASPMLASLFLSASVSMQGPVALQGSVAQQPPSGGA